MAATLITLRRPFLLHLIAVMLLFTLSACSSRAARPSAKVPMPSQEIIAGLLQSGRQAAAQGQYDRAIGVFRRVQEGYPNAPERPEATLLLAQALEKKGEPVQALAEYRRLVAEHSQTPQAILARTKIPELERQFPSVRPPVLPQVVGSEVGWEKLETLDERELARLRQSGVNTVFAAAARNRPSLVGGGEKAGVYFKTDWAPLIRDVLPTLVGAAHRQGMQVWATLPLRRMDWIDPTLEWADWRYNAQTGRLERAETLDLLHPALRDYLVGFLSDLASSGVDGVFLAADPPSAANEGFSTAALRRYERDSGRPVDPGRLLPAQGRDRAPAYAPEFWRWVGWKQREQMKVVAGVMEAVRALYPALKVAVEVHPETVTSPQAALAAYAEDLLDLRRYRVDYIAVGGAAAQGPLPGKAAEIVRGERLLLLVEPDERSAVKAAALPSGAGVVYREKEGQPRLTNRGR